jgi:hypothetical protein
MVELLRLGDNEPDLAAGFKGIGEVAKALTQITNKKETSSMAQAVTAAFRRKGRPDKI